MLPFVLLVTPLLIRAVARAMPSIVPKDVRLHSLNEDLPRNTFALAFLIPGIIMVLTGLASSYSILGDYLTSSLGEPTTTGIRLMFYVSGGILTGLGVLIFTGQVFFWKTKPSKKEELKTART